MDVVGRACGDVDRVGRNDAGRKAVLIYSCLPIHYAKDFGGDSGS
ncbi:9746_t:CDS:1, partial [Acaulospora colombiana]